MEEGGGGERMNNLRGQRVCTRLKACCVQHS